VQRRVAGESRRLFRRVAPAEDGARLTSLLALWLGRALGTEVPVARARALVIAGGVRVDGEALRAPGRPLRRGQLVEALVREELLRARSAATDRLFRLSPGALLFRDEWILAVDKPPGLPTHATADPGRPSLVGCVEAYLREQGERPYVGVHQRLDRDTTGVVLFATHPAANGGLARAFAGRDVEKVYAALTRGPAAARPRRFVVSLPLPSRAGGGESAPRRPAETRVVVREATSRGMLVEARPRTGRRHQVRAHLAHAGIPVLGDRTYGDAGDLAPRTMLHARRLALRHPVTGAPLAIESPFPPDFLAVLAWVRGGGPP
jgi:23S rRNA pseudouridine1911/1915/1917 synthase